MRRHIPNLITLGRLVLAAVFFILLGLFDPTAGPALLDAALGVFLVALFSDFLDGYLARRWNVVSAFGRIVDPLVDKIIVLGGFVYLCAQPLAGPSGVSPWMVAVMLTRELLVTSLRAQQEAGGQDFGAAFSGKLKMVLQSAAVAWCVFHVNRGEALGEYAAAIRDGLLWTAVAVTVLSGLLYLRRAFSPPAGGR